MFRCKICSKSFKENYSLQRHERIHNKENFLACGTCGKKFKRSDNLKRHERCHERMTIQREYSCNKCDAKFNNVNQLRLHIETVHPTPSTSGVKRKNNNPDKTNKRSKQTREPSLNGIYINSLNNCILHPSIKKIIHLFTSFIYP